MHTIESHQKLGAFDGWRASLKHNESVDRKLEKWLFLNISSVLLSTKSGELLNLLFSEFKIRSEEAVQLLETKTAEWGISFKIVSRNEYSLKFVVYLSESVNEALQKIPDCLLKQDLKHLDGLNAESFLEYIANKWESSGEIPHEIGFALGYQLEDVLGYLGILSLPCKGACGWQIYGCKQNAKFLSSSYKNAKKTAEKYLEAINEF
jgi:hypothetical protein